MPRRFLKAVGYPRHAYWPVVAGCVLVVAFWFLDAAAEAFLVAQRGWGELLFHANPDDMVGRFIASGLILAFALAAAVLRRRAASAERGVRLLVEAVEASPALVMVTDVHGDIVYVNPKFTAVTGYSFSEAVGRNPRFLKSGERSREEYEVLWSTLLAGKEWRGEFSNRRKNGELYWERASISALRDEDGEIAYFVAVKEDITEEKRLQKLLETLSTTDGLTGLSNWRHFSTRLEEEWKRAARSATALSLVMADVDEFKAFNDACGHLQGDECLKAVASVALSVAQRPGDVVARYGGEEFALILPGDDASGVFTVAAHLREGVERLGIPHPASRVAPTVTISVGAATMTPHEGVNPEALLHAADQALYRAKARGRNSVEVAELPATSPPTQA